MIDCRTDRRELVVAVNSVHVRAGMAGKFHSQLLRHSGVSKNGVEGVPQAVKRQRVNCTANALSAGAKLTGNNAGLVHDAGEISAQTGCPRSAPSPPNSGILDFHRELVTADSRNGLPGPDGVES
jgi:hypothetical protein